MKKHFLVMTALFLVAHVYGQGLYVKVGAGYALPMGSQSLIEPTSTTEITGNSSVATTKATLVKGSYGAGTVINGAVGYKFSPFIGLDLNLCYQLGKEYSGMSSLTNANGTFGLKETKKSKGIFVSPTMMFMAGTEGVRPYAVVGVILGTVKIENGTSITSAGGRTGGGQEYILKEETKGDLAFGFRGGIGVDVNLSTRFSLFAEGVFNSISYYAKESEYVMATLDGDDMLSDFSVSDRKTVYVDEITTVAVNGEENVDSDEPTQELRSPLPLGSIGINVGLKIKLGSD